MDLNRTAQHMAFDSEKRGVTKGLRGSRRIREQRRNPSTSANQLVQIQDSRMAFLLQSVALFTTIADLTAENGQGPGLYHIETH